MRRFGFVVPILGILAGLAPSSQGAVIFDGTFSGDFDPANWTLVLGASSNGIVYTGGAPASITLTGSNDELQPPLPSSRFGDGLAVYRIVAPTSGTLRFSWDYSTVDFSPSFDFVGYVLNGVYTDLSSGAGATTQSGVGQLDVIAGDVFGFFVDPTDNWGGAAEITISQAPSEAIPEPMTLGTAGFALLAFGLLRARRL